MKKIYTYAFIVLCAVCAQPLRSRAQEYGPELLKYSTFGTSKDGITAYNDPTVPGSAPLYPTCSNQTGRYQPATSAYVNLYWNDPNAKSQGISINPAVTVAPPIASYNTPLTFGFTATYPRTANYTFSETIDSWGDVTKGYTGTQIPAQPDMGGYVLATSTAGMYGLPSLTPATWYTIYDRYETNTTAPSNYFMITKTNGSNQLVLYFDSVRVVPGSIYRMSVDVARLTQLQKDVPPGVGFYLQESNSTISYGTNEFYDTQVERRIDSTGGVWHTYYFDYVVPCSTSSSVLLYVAYVASMGSQNNDLALDNFSFKQVIPRAVFSSDNDTLNAVLDLDYGNKAHHYTFTWYEEGNNTPIDQGSVPYTLKATDITASYHYTLKDSIAYSPPGYGWRNVSVNTSCPCKSPDYNDTPPPAMLANDDRIDYLRDSLYMKPYNVLANDDSNISDEAEPDVSDLRVYSFSIVSGLGIDPSVGVYYPGQKVVIIDNNQKEVGVLSIQATGDLSFVGDPSYPAYGKGGIANFELKYKATDTITNMSDTATIDIVLTRITHTAVTSCAGYPVRLVFDVPQFLANDFIYTYSSLQPSNIKYPPTGTYKGSAITINSGDVIKYPTVPDASTLYGVNSTWYMNDYVASHYYIVDGNDYDTQIDDISTSGNLQYGSASMVQTLRIDVVRTDNPVDGGKIIFEFLEKNGGTHSYQLRKKGILNRPQVNIPPYLGDETEDPILATAQVLVCPGIATWNGSSSTLWKDPNNWSPDGISASYPTWCTDVVIPSGVMQNLSAVSNDSGIVTYDTTTVTIANFPILQPNDACNDIVFESGASVGAIQNLTYHAAYVEYKPPRFGNSSTNKWTALSAPLKYMYSADYHPDMNWDNTSALSEIESYMSYFDLGYSATGTLANPDGETGAVFGSFSKLFAALQEPLHAGQGFISNIVLTGGGGTVFANSQSRGQGDSTFFFPRIYTASTAYGDRKLMDGLGVPYDSTIAKSYVEAPYAYHYKSTGEWITDSVLSAKYAPFTLYRGSMQKANISQWNADYTTTDSVAYVLTTPGSTTQEAVWTPYYKSQRSFPATTNYKASVTVDTFKVNPIVLRDSRYRFIFEQASLGYNGSTGSFSLKVGGSGSTRIVGNPFMSHLDFDAFYSANSGVIQPYYRVWDGTTFYTHIVSGQSASPQWSGFDNMSTGSDVSIGGYIPPMQAFFVETTAASDDSLALNFTTAMSTAMSTAMGLKTIHTDILKLRLNMAGVQTTAIIAACDSARDTYSSNEDVYKLFSYNDATPEIYSIASHRAIEINAVQKNETLKVIPLGIKTTQIGNFELSTSDLGSFYAYRYVYLHDVKEQKRYDLKQESNFLFQKAKQENLEGRLYVVFSNEDNYDFGTVEEQIAAQNSIRITREENTFCITSLLTDIDDVQVCDMFGRVIFQVGDIHAHSYRWQPKLGKGVYVITVHAGKERATEKIMW
ncbi:MAG: hypothetical protein LBU90_05490 [Bacteroidales bacterium]|jgi:hypothetical protein|nr:hypothetical protein [Bacteroidales bacterium]